MRNTVLFFCVLAWLVIGVLGLGLVQTVLGVDCGDLFGETLSCIERSWLMMSYYLFLSHIFTVVNFFFIFLFGYGLYEEYRYLRFAPRKKSS